MSNEIATYSMILSKLSLGKSGTECPTKTQILAINSLIVIDNASTYGANECVKIDDIRKKAETWNYYLTVSPTSMSFGAGGGSKSFTVSSYKRKVSDGVEQSGDTSVSLKSTTVSGTGFSLSGTTVSASANEGISNRTGTVTITQNESNKTATISLSQSGDTISSYGEWTISVSANPTSVSSSGGTSTITASAKRTVYWASGDVTKETGNPTLSTNLGSLNSSSSPSTLTLGENTSTSSRTATINATHGGKSATCTVTQSGATPADNYVFTWEDGSTSDVSANFPWDFSANGTAANIPVVSTKNGSSQSWSVSSKPSWITTSTTSSKVTISASDNSGSARSGEVVLTQSGSGNTLTINVSQDAYVADTYVFTITPNTYDASYSNTTFIPRTVSTKNGSNIGYSLTSGGTDWVVVSTTGEITVEILKNTTSSTRSTTLVFTQNESGKTQSIEITQSGYTPTYTFNVTPTNLSVTAAETNETLTVQSYKTVLKSDGSETTESLDYEFSSNNSWVAAARTTTNTNYITVAENKTTTQRTAKITLTQAESGAQAFVNVIQDGKAEEVVNKLNLNSFTYDSCYLFLLGTKPVKPNDYDYLMFQGNTSVKWYTSRGLIVNGGTAYAGNLVNIYVYSSGGYKLVTSFQLRLGEQTVTY